MHQVNLIANAIRSDPEIPSLPCEPVEGICALTGIKTECIPRGELLGKSFTNCDLLIRPDSNLVSVDAYLALNFKWERFSSWFCDGIIFEKLNRIGVREKVFQEKMPEKWIAYTTTSYKKHGVLNAKINIDKSRIWLFEMRLVDLTDIIKVNEWWNVLNKALRYGIGRSILETLECSSFIINKIGLRSWIEFEKWARPKYNSALYSFLCYLLPSREEIKNENKNGVETSFENY